ncbi:MAG: tRNA 2-thiouridine(34) synthase MnmA [Bacteroidales bacterium]|nr:tRNA 2-thiouridine(34) synthase MnmA [Bacteroidales bacterium]
MIPHSGIPDDKNSIENNKTKVLLGMSGGTDSSTSALILLEQGYEVIGITFVFCDGNDHHIADAASLAERLNIKHIVYDAREIFKKNILSYFISEYMSGRTPVPCIKCNNYLKWPLLAKTADEMGIYYIATGHYIKTIKRGTVEDEKIYISRGNDPDKDQSFFMWGLKPDLLKRIVVPLGSLSKSQVREIAANKGHKKVAEKKDSLGVCFCPGDYRDFLKSNVPSGSIKEGYFVDTNGKILGKHSGYPFFTVGQRRNLGIHLNKAIFVKEIIAQENKVVIASGDEMYKTVMYLKEVNVNYPEDLSSDSANLNYTDPANVADNTIICRIRYRKQNTPCSVELLDGNRAKVTFHEPLNSVAPGQGAAFYKGEILVGGGIIDYAL